MENLVQKSRSNDVDVDVIVGEAAYSGKDNIKMAATEDIELVSRLNPNISQGTRKDEDKTQMEFQQTDRFKILARERYKIEAKNSELKNVLGYDRALSYGLSCMEMLGAKTIFAANISRIVKMMAK